MSRRSFIRKRIPKVLGGLALPENRKKKDLHDRSNPPKKKKSCRQAGCQRKKEGGCKNRLKAAAKAGPLVEKVAAPFLEKKGELQGTFGE